MKSSTPRGRNQGLARTTRDVEKSASFSLYPSSDERVDPVASRREAADHELLPDIEAHLQPRATSRAGFICRGQALGDDAFTTDAPHRGLEFDRATR